MSITTSYLGSCARVPYRHSQDNQLIGYFNEDTAHYSPVTVKVEKAIVYAIDSNWPL